MACNCKAKEVADAAIEMSGENVENESGTNIFSNIVSFFARFAMGILVAAVFLVLAIPVIIYVAVCIIIGRQPMINIGKGVKWGSKLNGGD